MKKYGVQHVITWANKILDKLDAEEDTRELTTDEQILKSNLLTTLDLLEPYQFN